MALSIGIVGLPNAGKSTLFQALTSQQVAIASYPFTTVDPNIGRVSIPDPRLSALAEVVRPQKITHTTIEFIDIAGLVKGAAHGEGLGNQFLSYVRTADALAEVLRAFPLPEEGEPHAEHDKEVLEAELLLKDCEIVERVLLKAKKEQSAAGELFEKVHTALSAGTHARDILLDEQERIDLHPLLLITAKPRIIIRNTDGEEKQSTHNTLFFNLKLAKEASELSFEEREELGMTGYLDQFILACYNALDLLTFFTVAGTKETRAWTLQKGASLLEAASQVHSDFAEHFIVSETVPWNVLVKAGSWARAKEQGLIKTAGKTHMVQDGDVIEFKT